MNSLFVLPKFPPPIRSKEYVVTGTGDVIVSGLDNLRGPLAIVAEKPTECGFHFILLVRLSRGRVLPSFPKRAPRNIVVAESPLCRARLNHLRM